MLNKSAKEAALQKLMDLLDSHETDDLKSLKKPSLTEISIEADPKHDDSEGDGAPSDFAKAWEAMKGGKPAEDSPDEEAAESPDEELSEDDIKKMEAVVAAHRARK
jgi:hypothetical protein